MISKDLFKKIKNYSQKGQKERERITWGIATLFLLIIIILWILFFFPKIPENEKNNQTFFEGFSSIFEDINFDSLKMNK